MRKNIQNLKIGRKLHVLVGVALVGILLIGGMPFSLMSRLNEMTGNLAVRRSILAGSARYWILSTRKLS